MLSRHIPCKAWVLGLLKRVMNFSTEGHTFTVDNLSFPHEVSYHITVKFTFL
jgi:hypothetical protein